MDAEQILDAVQEMSERDGATPDRIAERLGGEMTELLPELEALFREGRLHRLRSTTKVEHGVPPPEDWTVTYLVRGKR